MQLRAREFLGEEDEEGTGLIEEFEPHPDVADFLHVFPKVRAHAVTELHTDNAEFWTRQGLAAL